MKTASRPSNWGYWRLILVPLFMGATELGRRAWTRSQLDNAAYAGVERALEQMELHASKISSAVAERNQASALRRRRAVRLQVSDLERPNHRKRERHGANMFRNMRRSGAPGKYVTVTATTTYTPLFHSCGGLLPTSVCPLSSGGSGPLPPQWAASIKSHAHPRSAPHSLRANPPARQRWNLPSSLRS